MASSPPPLSPKSHSTLLKDIKLIMHSYGDVSSPLPASVNLVHSVLQQQTHSLMCHLADVCNLRETTSITQDDILFLFRKNKVKLQRLLNHVKAKDLRTTINKEMEVSEQAVDTSRGKRMKACETFLSSIDSTDRLSSCVQGGEVDVAKQQRLMRQDLMSRTMSEDQYMKYHESRQVNLVKRLKSSKVRDWLFGDIEKQYKISPATLELIAYCMHEIIAEIIELCIMLKIESRRSSDPVVRLNPLQNTVNSDWLTQRAMLTSDLSAHSMLTSLNSLHNPTQAPDETTSELNAITTDEIREALRRRNERLSLLHPQVKQKHSLNNLLCL